MTLQNLGEQSGLTASYLSQIERDQTSPSIASLKKIAEAFNVRIVDFFVGGSEEEPVVMAPKDRVQVSLNSFYYSSLIPHAWTNRGKTRTVVVWVVSPPSW
jgi:transcriptional regulator with XRE-family HTH domain